MNYLSSKEVEIQYNKLMEDVKTNPFYTNIKMENRVNCYVCNCGKITKSKDVDPGVTPFMTKCSCGQHATSTMYKDIAPDLQPSVEWYRPSLDDLIENYLCDVGVLDHVLRGGLLSRNIEPDYRGKTIEEIIYTMSQAKAPKTEIDRAVAYAKLAVNPN